MDRRNLWMALAALIVIVSAVFGFSLTQDKDPQPTPTRTEVAQSPSDRFQAICASSAAYHRLKQLVFRQAAGARDADPADFQTLATNSVVRMENPVVKNRDEDLNVTVCSGRFVLELPPGAERGFDGQRRLAADVEYTAQPAVDGSGLVYRLSGAEPIVERLASFDLKGPQQAPAPAAAPQPQYAEAETSAPPPQRDEPREEARDEPPPPRRVEPVNAPAPSRTVARPSFNCAAARTRSERMVCSSGNLAASDRAMSSLYYSALNSADSRQRRALTRTRDRFLAYRERCGSEACIAEAYQGRMMEIRDIMAGRF